jgi:hypothetical protein
VNDQDHAAEKQVPPTVGRMVDLALKIDETGYWQRLSDYLQIALSPKDCAAILWAAAGALEIDTMPIASFDGDLAHEAASWAAIVDQDVLGAYALACFRNMTPDRQSSFRSYLDQYAAG